MKLYSFFNSSSSYRVRIALALKGLDYEYVPINIRVGQHRTPTYVALNSSASVPTLVDDETSLGQSLAIVDYLDAKYSQPRLIPLDAVLRAQVLEFSSVIGCDIHPVNNLRVLRYLKEQLGVLDDEKEKWYAHWMREGMDAAERLVSKHEPSPFAFGSEPTIADCWLIPQVANALRMKCSIANCPRLTAIYQHCLSLAAFQSAAPERQPDYVD
jgi:maleylacetoacetate isomerase